MSAVALAISAVPNVKADGALLSPRAQGNQIVHVLATTDATTVTRAARTRPALFGLGAKRNFDSIADGN
jgi:hypothetical protein